MQRTNFMSKCLFNNYVFLKWNLIYQASSVMCTKFFKNETKNTIKIYITLVLISGDLWYVYKEDRTKETIIKYIVKLTVSNNLVNPLK